VKRALVAALIAAACAHSKDNAPPPATVDQASAPAAAGLPPDAGTPQIATGTSTAVQTPAPAKPPEPAQPLMPEEAFRDTPPAPEAVQPHFEAPRPIEKKLKNGLRVLIVENHSVPLVSMDLRFLHGIDADPAGKAGLASFMADTVDEGTQSRPAEKLALEIEDLAASMGASAGLESSSAHLNCLSETLPRALDLFADIVRNPAFRKEDVERVRTLRLSGLQQKKASINALGADEVAKIEYGPRHPWGQPSGGTPESVASITPDDLRNFHRDWWVPNDAVLSISGDITPAQAMKLVEQKFGSWKPRPLPKLELPPLPPLGPRSIDALEKANATQSQVFVVGRTFPARELKDAIPLRVATLTLGGLFTSRLNMNLREQHGYSYGAFAYVSLMRKSGVITASSGVIAKHTTDALAEIEKELDRFQSGEVTQAELDASKEALIRGLPSNLETNDAVSGAMSNLVSLGLPLDYYVRVPNLVNAVTQADVKRVVQKWVKPAEWPLVVVGPVHEMKEPMEKLNLGPVRLAEAGK
jgi:zinc protease